MRSASSLSSNTRDGSFLSLRFTDPALKNFANLIKMEWEKLGHDVFLCAAGYGDSFGGIIANALSAKPNFVAFITLDPPYGENSGGTFTTHYELDFAYQRKKKIFPIMMYEDPQGF